MKKCLFLLLLLVNAAFAQTPQDNAKALDAAVLAPDLWETAASSWVEAQQPLGFHWISQTRDTAESTQKGVTFLGEPVCQTIARCEDDKITELTLFFYNRGDMGEIDNKQYDQTVRKAIAAITGAAKMNFTPKPKEPAKVIKVDGVFWATPVTTWLLEYSFSPNPFRAEFVRLKITPTPKPKNLVQASIDASRLASARFRGQDHITRDSASGDVAIKDIPMVDQGEKGYCVVASAERLLRYYGIKTDEHELAQIANSDAERGTSYNGFTESLKKLTARLKIRVRMLLDVDFHELVNDYNQAAKRARLNPVNPYGGDSTREIFSEMKPEVFTESRNKNRAASASFKRQIKARIDEGIPLLWSVTLGMLPTDGSHAKKPGGHMRLIIGYNDKTNEILFSDSWGPGHELKRISADDAWVITHGLVMIEPL